VPHCYPQMTPSADGNARAQKGRLSGLFLAISRGTTLAF